MRRSPANSGVEYPGVYARCGIVGNISNTHRLERFMPQDDESFLAAVLPSASPDTQDAAPLRAKRSPWPTQPPGESPEDEDPGEAYKPDVVGLRIRNALKSGPQDPARILRPAAAGEDAT